MVPVKFDSGVRFDANDNLAEIGGVTEPEWTLYIDTGGTFTDCIGRAPDGSLHRCKVLSSSALRARYAGRSGPDGCCLEGLADLPEDFFREFHLRFPDRGLPGLRVTAWNPATAEIRVDGILPGYLRVGTIVELQLAEEAPVLAARVLTRTPGDRSLPRLAMRLATTRGTNALLEEKGVAPLLFINTGLEDLLVIGDQRRPDLFALDPKRPAPLHGPVVPVAGRLAADGSEIIPLDRIALEQAARSWRERGFKTAAVCLMHSYRNPSHERVVAACLKEAGFAHVSISSDLAPVIRIVPRCETTVVDAYLAPVMNSYLDAVGTILDRGRLHVMTSSGGLVTRAAYRPKDSLLSGPAGGVVGTAAVARRTRQPRVIAFDMGGTSTDVSRYDGEFDYRFRQTIGRANVFGPALKIETVAAGGGSICRFDGRVLTVGPDSAGASPGPACYGAGGPLTLTDVNLLLGRLDPDLFGLPVFPEKARERFDEVRRRADEASAQPMTEEVILNGFLAIADERMAEAVRRISVREGYDSSRYALLAFGGAGGLHACGVARVLGIRTVLHPRDAGLLSALGLKEAVLERFVVEQVLRPMEEVGDGLAKRIEEVGRRALASVVNEGVAASAAVLRFVRAEMRFQGQETALTVPADRVDLLVRRFRHLHRLRYGHCPPDRAVELVALRAVASGPPAGPGGRESFRRRRETGIGSTGALRRERNALRKGEVLSGPVVVQDRFSTLFIERGWTGLAGDEGSIRLVADRAEPIAPDAARTGASIVAHELVSNRLSAVVEEMGELLQRTALSTNVKERLDFSCGLLDGGGELVVNAPHIPVHLGALGLCVRRVMETVDLRPGDSVVTNHPGFGGSHLPDVTLITPVFSTDGILRAFVANRAHHAEIGGIRPGSMPPDARTLEEEGVVIPPTVVARDGRVDWSPVERLLRESRFPSRATEENLADLDAQMAANRLAVRAVEKMIAALGTCRFEDSLKALSERAGWLVTRRFLELTHGRFEAEERLDDGTPLRVAIVVEPKGIRVDFAGSGAVHPGNLNTTPAVVRSALLYVLRLFVRTELPLNEGLLRPITWNLPPGLLNPPFAAEASRCPPVVGGNVETSQRLVDLLVKALRLAACSQGTMNNLIFGTSRGSYYETMAGGAGAGPGFAGGDAIHTHMTNTAITDPEVLEWRHPVRLWQFGLRSGSGGKGRYRGGNGIRRELEFLEPAELSLLTQHRVVPPFGLEGGGPGACGRQWVIRAGGRVETLPPVAAVDLAAGDRVVIETPGGGGWGREQAGRKGDL